MRLTAIVSTRLAIVVACVIALFASAAIHGQQRDAKRPTAPESMLVPDDALAVSPIEFDASGEESLLVTIPALAEIDLPATGTDGVAAPYPASVAVSGVVGTIGRLSVTLHSLSHSCPGDLQLVLVGPAGQKVGLLGSEGGCSEVSAIDITLRDGAPALPSPLTTGVFAPSGVGIALPAPAPALPYASTLSVFNGTDPNGLWRLFAIDAAAEDAGRLFGFTLSITPQFDNNTPLPIVDLATRESAVTAANLTGPISKVTVSFHLLHTFDADLDISLVGPDGTTIDLTSDNGGGADNFGTSCGARTTFDDASPTAITAGVAPFAGSFRPETPLAAFNGKSGAAANGTWTLRIVDDLAGDIGTLQCWSLTITQDDSALVRPPTGLTVTSVAGNTASFRWNPPTSGPTPTGYIFEGGIGPGSVLATFPTSTVPVLDLSVPNGAFHVRVRTVVGAVQSVPSNEVQLFVNQPVPPSRPYFLKPQVSDLNTVTLQWENSFKGGQPTGLRLDAQGIGFNLAVPLGFTDRVQFASVPGGTYTLSVVALNGAGVSAPSDPVQITVPAVGCTESPRPPGQFLAYKVGNTIFTRWDAPLGGAAPRAYQLTVTGAFNGSFVTPLRALSGAVAPGTYNLSVQTLTPCAASDPTPVQSVTVTVP